MDKLTVLHEVPVCPGCGWPSHADNRGRMMCCEGIHVSDIPKIKRRRCAKRGNLTPGLASVETRGGSAPSPTLSTGQLDLWK